MGAPDLTNPATGASSHEVRAGLPRALVTFLGRYPGLDVPALLADAALSPARLADPEARVPAAAVARFLGAAAAAAAAPSLGLAFAQQVPWREFGVYAFVALHAPTLGAALASTCRYFRLQSTGARLHLEVDGEDARLIYALTAPGVASYAQNTQFVLGLLTRMGREALRDPRWSPRAVHITDRLDAAGAELDALRGFFRCPIELGQGENALVLAPDDLRRVLPAADGDVRGLLQVQADQHLARIPVGADDLGDQVRQAIGSLLHAGDVTLEAVASRLGTTPRTLQRRLAARDLAFKDVVAEVRLARALRYVEDADLSLTDAAFLLGYSELSAFSRAFRRWTGRSARVHRLRSLAAVGPRD